MVKRIQIVQIGKPLFPDRRFHQEAYHYNYDINGHQLLIALRTVRPEELMALTTMPIQLAVSGHKDSVNYPGGSIVFLHFKVEGVFDWSDAPYSIHLVPEHYRQKPSLFFPEGQGAALTIVVVEGVEGVVRGIRLIGLSLLFSLTLHRLITRQMKETFNRVNYDQHLSRIYTRYTSDQLAEMAIRN
jgi:hypothetical protein